MMQGLVTPSETDGTETSGRVTPTILLFAACIHQPMPHTVTALILIMQFLPTARMTANPFRDRIPELERGYSNVFSHVFNWVYTCLLNPAFTQ